MEIMKSNKNNQIQTFVFINQRLWKFWEVSSRKNVCIKHEFCIFFVPHSVFPLELGRILLNLYNLGQFWTADRKGCWKITQIKFLSALQAKKLPNEKRKEFCGIPCILAYLVLFGPIWTHLNPFGNHLEAFGPIWTYFDQYGPIWTSMKASEPCRILLVPPKIS